MVSVPERFDGWLTSQGLSYAEAGRKLGVADSTVHRWAHGKRKPSLPEAVAIEKLTAGTIRADAWPHLAALLEIPRRRASRS